METWYLAGNCIENDGLKKLVTAWTKSDIITSIWLKRNPLGPQSTLNLHKLISNTPNLRTLDLDMTELGNESSASLFATLACAPCEQLPLRNLYLNANGIGKEACEGIAAFISSPVCGLESLYLSNNPIG